MTVLPVGARGTQRTLFDGGTARSAGQPATVTSVARPAPRLRAPESLQLEVDDSFRPDAGWLVRTLRLGGRRLESRIPGPAEPEDRRGADEETKRQLRGHWLRSYLEGAVPAATADRQTPPLRTLRTVDLFCGAGGFALGVRQLAAEAGRSVVTEAAADVDAEALRVFAANHRTNHCLARSVASLVDFRLRGSGDRAEFVYEPEIVDSTLAEAVSEVDLITAGPPCQGHSNLNNRSRRDDRRNRLFLTVPAMAAAARARAVVIENVPAVVHDHGAVTRTARCLFRKAGYTVDEAVIAADRLGWPQTRRRYFMVASRSGSPLPLGRLAKSLADEARSIWWAIGDLEDRTHDDDPMNRLSQLSDRNSARVESLFDQDAFDLPLEERPVCHRDGTTYPSVYGRMHPDRPAPTITTGFMSPGRGRFVHPTRPRTLTAREAARLQGFPDTYRFVLDPERPPTRHNLAKWIGDAVPMPLGYVSVLSGLAPELVRSPPA